MISTTTRRRPFAPIRLAGTLTAVLLLAAVLALATACGGPAPSETEPADPPAPSVDDTVEYEPAYPADVSAEGLSEEDITQQHGETHSHGDGDHMHDDGDHMHDDGDHMHDDGDHMHDDDHSHGR